LLHVVFFFSSRRRHTRFSRDWSSDVCSSDLYMVPAIFISLILTDHAIPPIGFGSSLSDGTYLLDKLDGLGEELGFGAYTEGRSSMIDVFFITAALMVGTAGLPHVIVRFFTVPKVKDARISAGYAVRSEERRVGI